MNLVISPKLAFLLNKLGDIDELDITSLADEAAAKVYLKRKDGMLYSKGDYLKSKHAIGYSVEWDRNDPEAICLEHHTNGVRAYQIGEAPSKYLVHLDYYDFNELLDLRPSPGSTYIRASSEPFDDEMRLDENRLKRWLRHFDVNAPTHEPRYVHASGAEIGQLIREVNPRVVFPIHTEEPEAFSSTVPESTAVAIPREGQQYTI